MKNTDQYDYHLWIIMFLALRHLQLFPKKRKLPNEFQMEFYLVDIKNKNF